VIVYFGMWVAAGVMICGYWSVLRGSHKLRSAECADRAQAMQHEIEKQLAHKGMLHINGLSGRLGVDEHYWREEMERIEHHVKKLRERRAYWMNRADAWSSGDI